MDGDETKRTIWFAGFELDTAHRRLLREGEPVALNAKAFDLLVFLAENVGRVVTKDEILDAVWNGQFVEEANLTVQMSALRRALGDSRDTPRFLVTVPGKGYEFIGDIEKVDDEIVIEKQKVTHVVVESDLEFPDDEMRASLTEALPPYRNRRFLPAAVLALIVLLPILIFFVAPRMYNWSSARTTTQIRSIAVLPFKPLVAESRNESLEMGMADTLIARLSGVNGIDVRPITAVSKYSSADQDAVAAGAEQNVDAVIDGNIQTAGDKIRVTVRMVRVSDGTILLTNQFDEQLTDIFKVQDLIAERVAGVLASSLTGDEKERLTKHSTEDAEAYQLYLTGRYHLSRLTNDGIRKSLEYFEQAVAKDPNFALAHVGVSDACTALAGFNVARASEVFPRAKTAALRALEIDPTSAEAHTALAAISFVYDWDWATGGKEFRRALELNSGDPNTHSQFAYYLAFTGQFDEAIAEMRRAQQLDPVSPAKFAELGQVFFLARRYDEAIQHCNKALELDPNLGFAHWLLGLAYMEKGEYESAIAELQRSIPLSGDSLDEPAALAIAHARAGRNGEARKFLAELKHRPSDQYVSPTMLAMVHAAIGEKDEAFSLLDRAINERDSMLVVLKVEPLFEPLRSDARFATILGRIGLN